MEQMDQVKVSLRREYTLYSAAAAFYKKALREFETKYGMTTQRFLKKFAAGKLGDESDFFDWYAFARLLARARETTSAIRSALQ